MCTISTHYYSQTHTAEMQGRSGLQEGSSQQRNSTKQITQNGAPSLGHVFQGSPLLASRVWKSVLQVHPRVGACFWAQLLLCACLVGPAYSQLTDKQQESIVKLHNYYRRRTEPSAANMRSMEWDPRLKLQAERYAVKCLWKHNPDLEDLEVGENLFAMMGRIEPSKALEQWFMEHKSFDYDNNSCTEDMMCGHYTQMVWAESYSVGCALHHCDTIEGLFFEKADFLVCNYFPTGNYDEEKPYEKGEWCTNCPENIQRCDKNLCVPEEVRVEEEGDKEDEEEEEKEETESSSTPTGTGTANHDSHPRIQQTTTLTPQPGLDMTYPTNAPTQNPEERKEIEGDRVQQMREPLAAGGISKTSFLLAPMFFLLNLFLGI